MKGKRKIAVFTGNRAEYGLLYPVLKAISQHQDLDYYLLVSGSHLQKDFGYTLKEIENDGFKVYGEVKLKMEHDNLYSTAQAIGSGITSLSKILNKLSPDIMVVYADRFEGFSAVITSTQMSIPTAHIEGGDITEGGALDDSVRHAMTKLSHLHFTTNEEAANRIKKLGEEPWRVFNVGFPAIDLIADGNFASVEKLTKQYNIDITKPLVLFTQHSVTTEYTKASEQILTSLRALNKLSIDGCQVIITYPNNDAGGKQIINEIENFKFQSPNIKIVNSMGRFNYHGILHICGKTGRGICVGNSSSGIKETPAFGCPNINIGSRQNGRLRARNVIDVDYNENEIFIACHKGLFDDKFREKSKKCFNPYGNGNAGIKIAKILSQVEINNGLLQKKMTY